MLSSLILMSAFKISITIIMLCKNTGSYLLERVCFLDRAPRAHSILFRGQSRAYL